MKDVTEDIIKESLEKFNEKRENDKKLEEELIFGQKLKIDINNKVNFLFNQLEKILEEIKNEYYFKNSTK